MPCVVLEYQPECLDFAATLEWERFTIRTSELSAADLIERVEAMIAELPVTRKTLHNNAERLCQRFEEYCQAIEPMVAGKAAAVKLRISALPAASGVRKVPEL